MAAHILFISDEGKNHRPSSDHCCCLRSEVEVSMKPFCSPLNMGMTSAGVQRGETEWHTMMAWPVV